MVAENVEPSMHKKWVEKKWRIYHGQLFVCVGGGTAVDTVHGVDARVYVVVLLARYPVAVNRVHGHGTSTNISAVEEHLRTYR